MSRAAPVNTLKHPAALPTNNILDMAREGLRIELSSALRNAQSSAGKVTRKKVSVKTNGGTQLIDLHVCPQQTPKELAGLFLIVFEDIDTTALADISDQDLPDGEKVESSGIARWNVSSKSLVKTTRSPSRSWNLQMKS